MFAQGHFFHFIAWLSAFFLGAGVVGLAWSTVGTPWIVWVIARVRSRLRAGRSADEIAASVDSADSPILKLEIIVAAYNEERVLAQTLRSLIASADRLRAERGGRCELSITVGLDHCTDATADIVREVASTSPYPVHGVENEGERGKWNTLLMLIGRSRADWVALVDSGSVWNAGLLAAAWPSLRSDRVVGVAPSYSPAGAGVLERANWRLERALKTMENASGGPVSVHGATVLYRRSTLLVALLALEGIAWLNDDVVVPLTLRLQNPARKLVYLSAGVEGGWVTDVGVSPDAAVEFRRRRRMVMGNLQWIRAILLPRLNVLLVASRRVFRVFWAYWVLLAALGAGLQLALLLADVSGTAQIARALVLELGAVAALFAIAGGVLFSNWVRRLAMAFCSGLLVGRYWKEINANRGVSWV